MPNHIQNRLKIIGSPERVKEILLLIGDGKSIDFEKIIPPPVNIFRGNLSMEDERRCELQGIPTWYRWNIDNWGTKWNAYSQDDERNTIDTIFFQTAWSHPVPIIEKMAKMFSDVEIIYDYADEDSGCNTGSCVCRHGNVFESHIDNGSKEAYDIYFDLHPGQKDNYIFKDGKYEYKDGD